MISTVQVVERVRAVPPNVVTGTDEAVDVLIDRRTDTHEFTLRRIQNIGTGTVLYAVDATANSVGSMHGQLKTGESVEIPSMGRVSVFGDGTWLVATLELYRV